MNTSSIAAWLSSIMLVLGSGCGSSGTAAHPSPGASQPQYTSFGDAPRAAADAPTVSVRTLLADVDGYEGKYLRVTGTVSDVCPKRGCWLSLADDGGGAGRALFVKFTCPVNGRLIPAEAVGKEAVVEGAILVKTISEAEARHYKEDAGATPEEIAKVVGPQKQVTVAAPSARIAGLGQAGAE